MKRRSFIKGVTAAGAVSIVPANLITGCKESHAAGGWDFDEVIDRSGTWSIKYGRAGKVRLAMWIADMDFRTDPVVREALQQRLDRDVLGYTSTPEEFFEAVRYSGYLAVFPYVASNARALLPEGEYEAWIGKVCERAKEDYNDSREYWRGKRVDWIDKFQSWFYNLYLKSNGVSEGIKDY